MITDLCITEVDCVSGGAVGWMALAKANLTLSAMIMVVIGVTRGGSCEDTAALIFGGVAFTAVFTLVSYGLAKGLGPEPDECKCGRV